MKENQPMSDDRWGMLEAKIRALTVTQLHEWTDTGSVLRGQDYCDHVGSVVRAGDVLAGRVEGTKTYLANVGLDDEGELTGVCTCPVGFRCKHTVALMLVAQKMMAAGEAITLDADASGWTVDPEAVEQRLASPRVRISPPTPPAPPPHVVRRLAVTENPFGLWTANGSRSGKSFSFRTADGTCRWDIVVASFAFLLAKGSLDSPEGRRSWWGADEGEDLSDPALFVCSCGDRHCGGFGDESCEMTRTEVVLRVDYRGETVELVFSRVRFEYWVLQMLWRMQGSPKLRRDPLDTLKDKDYFRSVVNRLLTVRPRCRAMWERMKSHRRFDDADFEDFESQSPDAGAIPLDGRSVREFFPRWFSTRDEEDLCQATVRYEERNAVQRLMESETVPSDELFVYVSLEGVRKSAVELLRGETLDVVREGDGKDRPWRIRVDSLTRGRTIGCLERTIGRWVGEMMERHGLVVSARSSPFDCYDHSLPLRLDLSFADPFERRLCWGDGLETKDRFYFEMLRSVALHVGRYSAAFIKGELEHLGWVFREVKKTPEIAFLLAVISASAREVEYRLTDEEVAKRRRYCEAVRRSLSCRPVGKILRVGGFRLLPLRAEWAESEPLSWMDLNDVSIGVRLTWGRETEARPTVEVKGFPPDATGFAVFRGSEMIDLCLTGVAVETLGLFANMGVYDGYFAVGEDVEDAVAYERVRSFLAALPVKEPYENGNPPYFSYDRGIESGSYKISERGKLVFLRFVMLGARRNWVR